MQKFFFCTLLLLMFGCGLPPAYRSIETRVPFGSSVEAVCSIKDPNIWQKRFSVIDGKGPEVDLCNKETFINFDSQNKTMIIAGKYAGKIAGAYFIFEDVNKPLNCNFLFCDYGDGRFKSYARSLDEARRILDPQLMAAYLKSEEERKVREEKEQKARDKEAAIKEQARRDYCGSDYHLNWSWRKDNIDTVYFEFTAKSDRTIRINKLNIYTSENKLIKSEILFSILRPYGKITAYLDYSGLNPAYIQRANFSCEFADSPTNPSTNTFTGSSNQTTGKKETYKLPSYPKTTDDKGGAKSILEKILK